MIRWLLLFVPAAIALEWWLPDSHTLIFAAACLAMIPLAGWLGRATEQLAHRAGEGVGALLNATFGNAAELVIALMALRHGLAPVVKASLTGSILGNILLVLGVSIVAGGIRHSRQKFNVTGARAQATLLTLGAIALIMPAAFHALAGREAARHDSSVSLAIAFVLLAAYVLHLVFSLKTHKQFFSGEAPNHEAPAPESEAHWSLKRSVLTLAGATAAIVWISEILVSSVRPAAESLGMTSIFIGVIVVAVVGNAAEHSTAVILALKDRMGIAMGIAVGSSLQIALLVAPILVIASRFIGPHPMDLMFSPAEVVAIFLAVLITGQIASDGETNWIEGVQLLAVYLIMCIVFYFLPESAN